MSLLQAMRRHANFRARQIATVEGDVRHDWRHFEDRVLRLAEGLRSLGVSPGDKVGILALNSRAYHEAEFAIWAVQAVAVPMNIRWSTAENAYALDDSDIHVLFADCNFHDEAEALRQSREGLVVIGMDAENAKGDATSEQLIAVSSGLLRYPDIWPGPLTHISPGSPCATGCPFASTTLASTVANGVPTDSPLGLPAYCQRGCR